MPKTSTERLSWLVGAPALIHARDDDDQIRQSVAG